MPSGLANDTILNDIAKSMVSIFKLRKSTMTLESIYEKILESVKEALRSIKVPLPEFKLDKFKEDAFDSSNWRVMYDLYKHSSKFSFLKREALLPQTKRSVDAEDLYGSLISIVKEIGGVLVHEARHCEQNWRIIKLILADSNIRERLDRKRLWSQRPLPQPSGPYLPGRITGIPQLGRLPLPCEIPSKYEILSYFPPSIIKAAIVSVKKNPMSALEEKETQRWLQDLYGKNLNRRPDADAEAILLTKECDMRFERLPKSEFRTELDYKLFAGYHHAVKLLRLAEKEIRKNHSEGDTYALQAVLEKRFFHFLRLEYHVIRRLWFEHLA